MAARSMGAGCRIRIQYSLSSPLLSSPLFTLLKLAFSYSYSSSHPPFIFLASSSSFTA